MTYIKRVKKEEPKAAPMVVAPVVNDAAFYRIERRLAYLKRVPSISILGPLYPVRVKGRSKRGWTTAGA